MSIGTQPCDIVLPGYVLTERIGSGGYAEVWRAEAPGGIEKAVKIVYGHYDDELASQELKALERIKGVRHPFLLSLERFEVINGRLAILTELADMSLDQRLSQCRGNGLPGIPRDELLRYLADAAEALDFLSQRHNLLHLDIKPENLLVLGDHIKVADFGLVKELATRTQNSLVSGLTPTYASPEMFDDDPTAHSDQYSLAIVYQEMLVGTLPFPGRTAAQLAKQHMQAEPQLMSLSAEDRPIVARALAKKPTDRYPSCRAFVDALLHRGEPSPPAVPAELPRPIPAAPPTSERDPDDTKPPSYHKTLCRAPGQALDQLDVTVTQPVQRGERAPAPPALTSAAALESFVGEDSLDIAVPATNADLRREQPTLYVAIGGAGIQVLCRLRALIASSNELGGAADAIEAIALDTDREELREACSSRWKSPLLSDDTLHLPLRLPKSYDNSREILGWVSRRWLYNIPRSLETRGYRPLGRVALVDQSARVRALLDQKLQRLASVASSTSAAGEARDATIKVVLLAGTGGGTGAGMVVDVANAAKSLAATHNLQVEIHGVLLCTCFGNNTSSPLMAANSYSLLTELNHAMACGNEGTGDRAAQSQLFESPEAPFDCVYWVPARSGANEANTIDIRDTVANYLALETNPDVRAVLRSSRVSPTPRERSIGQSLSLRKMGFASLAVYERRYIDDLAVDLASAIERHWLSTDASADWERLVITEQQEASVPKLEMAAGADVGTPPVVVPINDATPLALRGRFKEFMSREFTSEIVRQIQSRVESRDERGRPLLLARDAKLVADAARVAVAALAQRGKPATSGSSRFVDAPVLHPLIATGSRRVLSHVVEKLDLRQPERVLSVDALEEAVVTECRTLLEECLTQPDIAAALTSLMEFGDVAACALEQVTTNPLQCASDRRTLVFVPQGDARSAVVEQLQSSRPLSAVVPANVNDVLVVAEEAGISAKSVALGLERVFPGIADAARRLHTRIDVEWQCPV